MNTVKTKKIKLYKVLSIFFLITTIAVASVLIFNILKLKEQRNDGVVSVSEFNQLSEDYIIAEKILKLDQQLLENVNSQNLLETLESLLTEVDNNSLKNIISNRISFTKSLAKTNNDNELSLQDVKIELLDRNKQIDSLVNAVDSLSTTFVMYRKKVERKTDSLIAASKKKENQLSRKETIKVITFKNSSGNLIHYLGETESDKAKGNGVGIWNTGSIYRGEWLNNKRHGNGEFSWTDGQKYSGDFVEDIRTGSGIYYWPSGEKYEGEFLNNKRHGNGTFYDPDGNVKFKGEWKNDKFLGS